MYYYLLIMEIKSCYYLLIMHISQKAATCYYLLIMHISQKPARPMIMVQLTGIKALQCNLISNKERQAGKIMIHQIESIAKGNVEQVNILLWLWVLLSI